MLLRNPFNRNEGEKAIHPTGGEEITQQHMANEVDINTIVSRFIKTGQLGNPMDKRVPMFGDISHLDFQTMQNAIVDIDNKFSSLPAKYRNRFGNDPYQMLRFIDDKSNEAECIKMGLLPGTIEDDAPPASPTPAPVTPP